MNYIETIDYLYSLLPMYQREGAVAYKENLGNINELLLGLNNPHQSFKSIHIAGTNGKGSTSHILTSILMEAGYQVGTYTSPHYLDFRERIGVNGTYISEQAVIDFVALMQNNIERIKPSFFELTVAMSFWYFKEQLVDIAVIEVGLGGRLDSTNVIQPLLSVITNIGFDHQHLLGNSLQEIATEKAGIIKPNTPVVIGKTQPETEQLFQSVANQNQCIIRFADQEYSIQSAGWNPSGQSIILQSKQEEFSIEFETDLLGNYQLENIRTAFCAYSQLSYELNLTLSSFTRGLRVVNKNSKLIGRFQIVHQKPTVIADSSHNESGIREFLSQALTIPYNRLWIIYATVSDKDVSKIIPYFPKTATIILTEASVPRKMPVVELESYFTEFTNVILMPDSKQAYAFVLDEAKENDLILMFGSIFLVADLLKYI